MKKFVLTLLASFIAIVGNAQHYVIDGSFKPLSFEELMMTARVNAYLKQEAKRRFDEYQDIAYKCYNKGEYGWFIYYSDCALQQEWYDSKLYYDRGLAYEKLNVFSKAKKEYKRALKNGYYPAQYALEQCKAHQKAWKKSRKTNK